MTVIKKVGSSIFVFGDGFRVRRILKNLLKNDRYANLDYPWIDLPVVGINQDGSPRYYGLVLQDTPEGWGGRPREVVWCTPDIFSVLLLREVG